MLGASDARGDEGLVGGPLFGVVEGFGGLRRSVQKNLVVLTAGFVQLLGGCRSGQGRLLLLALARCLPTVGTAHAREKRLHRFLGQGRLDPRAVSGGLASMVFGRRGRGLSPVVCDQTAVGGVQALVAGVPFAGRVLPLAAYTFAYPWSEAAVASQNQLEELFLADLETALPAGVRAVFVADRGLARASLLRHSQAVGRLFVIRGRAGTCVTWQGRRLKLGELPRLRGRACRYPGVLYQAQAQVRVDVVVYQEPTFQEPWFLLVPPDSAGVLPTNAVVALYRERMQVEQAFRDFKTHLGLRGLRLKKDVAVRTGRLLLAFLVAYTLALYLGASAALEAARPALETPRRTPRHGTTRTLSVLMLACLALALPSWRAQAQAALAELLASLARAEPLLPPHPPPLLRPLPAP